MPRYASNVQIPNLGAAIALNGDEQVEIVKDACSKAKSDGCDTDINENSNGNALAFICEAFINGR